MQAYSYGKSSHHNANRLLGKCPGVDGLKTGFVCASGYNITATARRGGVRILAVVMGARTPWIRLAETEKLIEAGFRECGSPYSDVKCAVNSEPAKDAQTVIHAGKESRESVTYARRHKKAKVYLARNVAGVAKNTSSKVFGKEKTKIAARSSVGTKKKSTVSASIKSRSGQAVAKKKSEVVKSAYSKAGKANQTTKVEKSQKSGKQHTKTASLKKKGTALKHSPQAQVSKKKAKG
jgi:D-alanyl-D-alanine carboxypeptidase (penicillin-binding protein 5/6)